MVYVREVLGQVVSSLARNKLRSFLTMGGIAWGIASIVLIVAMGDGFKEGQRKNIKSLGEDIVIVFPGQTEKQVGGQRAGRRIRLDYSDVRDIRKECFLVRYVLGEQENEVRAASSFNSGTFDTNGVEPLYARIRTIPVSVGRFLNEEDANTGRRVCVLGDNVRKQLFAERSGVVGSEIRLNSIPFQVVGLMPAKNQNSSYSGMDVSKIFVPYTALIRDLPPPKDENFRPGILNNLVYVPASLRDWKGAQKQVRRVLGRNHRFDPDDPGALFMWDTVESNEMADRIFESMTLFLGAIALVTLTLGGVGVMNIMLVSVSERTREIGMRKALGATRLNIMIDFLAEGMLLAFLSGTAGWLVSWGLASVVNSFPMPDMFSGLPVSRSTTLWAFAALSLIAVLSALWPAWRAASLTPVEALRYER